MVIRTKTILSIVVILVGVLGFIDSTRAQERYESSMHAPSGGTTGTPDELAAAIVSPLTASCLTGTSFSGVPIQGAVFTNATPLQGFPTDTGSFLVLSNGEATAAPGVATIFHSSDLSGVGIPPAGPNGSPDALTSFDAVTLTLTFDLPPNPGLLSFDWKFGTEENPTFTSTFPDYFRADVTPTTGPMTGSSVNIALLPDLSPVTVTNASLFSNAPTGSSTTPGPPFPSPDDVVYNAVTSPKSVAFLDLSPFGGETITLALRVADVNDPILDSAAFLDKVTIQGCEVEEGLPTTTSIIDTVETGSSTCPIEIFVDRDGCALSIVPDDTCPTPTDSGDFTVVIDGNSNTTAAKCEGNAVIPGSFTYCYPNATGSMTCITFG